MCRLLLFVLAALFFLSCTESYSPIHTETVVVQKQKFADDTLVYDTLSNKFISRITGQGGFGMRFNYNVPTENQNKKMWLIFKGKIKTNFAHSNSTITVTAADRDRNGICWKAIFLKTHYTDVNTWSHFCDSMFLPATFDGKPYVQLSAFAFLTPAGLEKFDMDSLQITVKCKS